MSGKAALLFVIGFSLLMGGAILNLNHSANKAGGNMSSYNAMTASHNLALAGANVGLAKLYRDTSWGSSGSVSITQSFDSGPFTGTFQVTAWMSGGFKMLRSVSTYPAAGTTYRDTVEVTVNSNSFNTFSLYAWMTNNENGVFWITGDTVWGRVHSNDNLTVSGSPVFLQKVTTAKGFIPPLGQSQKIGGTTYTNQAIFKNPPQPETGVAPITFPSDLSDLAAASTPANGGKTYASDIWVTLDARTSANGDGVALIRATQTGPVIDTVRLGDPNFDGVILTTGVAYVQGTLDGKLTIASYSSSSATKNNIVIEGDITYESDPRQGPSDDVLGLVANNNVIVADDVPAGQNRIIQASIFARTGSFTADNYQSRPVEGELQILGSIVQNTRGAVGTFSGSTNALKSGFHKNYMYDDRLSDLSFRPPHYVGFYSKTSAISQWWESYQVMKYSD